MSRVLMMSVLGSCLVAAQTTKIDLQNQSRGVDFSASTYTKPAKTGAALPPNCSTGEAYVLTTAVPGGNFFICTATNTWALQGGQGPIGPPGPAGPQGPAGTTGVSDHGLLTHLDFNSSGHTGFQPALTFTPVDAATVGQPNGPAKLGSDGKILASELPATAGGGSSGGVAFSTEPASGNGSQQIFNLAATPVAGSLTVSVNGQIQEDGPQADYRLSGSTVTFMPSSIPPNGARISFRYAVSAGGGSSAPVSGAQTFTATGTTTWIVPAGVTRVYAQVWGAGSGGYGGRYDSGSGGSGGGYADNWCFVTPGSSLTVTVGAGGAGGIPGGPAPGAGGDSSFDICAAAKGGGPGSDPTKFVTGYDLSLGQAAVYAIPDGAVFSWFAIANQWHPTDKVYTPLRLDLGGVGAYSLTSTEGNGQAGSPAIKAGGGGGSGGRTLSAANVSGGVGGASARGGAGGTGGGVSSSASVACTSGAAPGGAGGGGAWDGTNARNGCDGARGQVVLLW